MLVHKVQDEIQHHGPEPAVEPPERSVAGLADQNVVRRKSVLITAFRTLPAVLPVTEAFLCVQSSITAIAVQFDPLDLRFFTTFLFRVFTPIDVSSSRRSRSTFSCGCFRGLLSARDSSADVGSGRYVFDSLYLR